MKFPVEIGVAPFVLSLHLICETLAFVLGFRYFVFLRNKTTDPIPQSNRVWIIIGAAFGAFFFSRLAAALEDPVAWAHSTHKLLYFYASKTIIGGLLGGLIGVELVKKAIGEKSSSGDLFTYPLILAMIIGRVGCFSSGVYEPTFGVETRFLTGMDLGDGLLRHPVALYEIVFLLLLWAGLRVIEKRVALQSGYRFQLFMISYLIFRFLIEFIKPRVIIFAGIGTLQFCCLAGCLYYYKTIFHLLTNRTKLLAHG
ncbi:MAG: diacylglyceryl transferase [Bacteroidetes bacterium]|nr:MAG: diacylglyceryl transferase [Bacteroidota bacterium]